MCFYDELNEDVAIKVMGWTRAKIDNEIFVKERWQDQEGDYKCIVNAWKPSINMNQALQIMEKFDNITLVKGLLMCKGSKAGYECAILVDDKIVVAIAKTAQLAICRSALKAVERMDDDECAKTNCREDE